MKKVIVRGPALSQSGYGEHTRFTLRALQSRPDLFDIYLINTPWGATSWIKVDDEERQWIDSLLAKTITYHNTKSLENPFDMSIQVTIPNEWEKMAPVNIGVTAGTESTKISPTWMEHTQKMDKIIVVSNHTKYAFENTEYSTNNPPNGHSFVGKVRCPIDVIGYPVKNIEKEEIDLDLKYDFNFLTVGTWIPRKNLENTIKWFVEEFYDQKVGLVIKTSAAKNCLRDRRFCEERLYQLLHEYKGRKCQISLLHGDLTESEMTGLYNHSKIKAIVSLSHGEGFGLPLFEAAYNGLPIIAPNWGGQVDFLYMSLKQKSGKLKKTAMFTPVAFDFGFVQPEAVWEPIIIKDSQWCFPKEWDYKKGLRALKKNYTTCKSRAVKLQKWIHKEFSQEKVYENYINVLYQKEEKDKQRIAVFT